MKKKNLIIYSTLSLLVVAEVAGWATFTILATRPKGGQEIEMWVGSESVDFYRGLVDEFKKSHSDFGYAVNVVGADTGTAAAAMINDNTACPEIITIAHDNIGKLSRMNYIAPIVENYDDHLLDQILADNPESFKKAIINVLGQEESISYTFAVPYISQALFLYYDTRYVTAEQAKTFEGLREAAAAQGDDVKSYMVTGTDGYNFSFTLLARNISAGNVSNLRLYEGGNRYDCYNQDNDQVATLKWMQRSYEDPNGGMLDFDGQWYIQVQEHKALSAIGGAWHYNFFKNAVGEENVGCAVIPTFTLTAADVEGINDVVYPEDQGIPQELWGTVDTAPKAGDVYRGGSFVDCKCFALNMAKLEDKSDKTEEGKVKKYKALCTLLKYLSSKDAQNGSFKEATNVPAYVGADEFINSLVPDVDAPASVIDMAKAQTGMNIYGIPQPFVTGTLNTYFYSKSTPDLYKNCIKKISGSGGDSVDGIRRTLWRMQYIWEHGTSPKSEDRYPTSYPAEAFVNRNKDE